MELTVTPQKSTNHPSSKNLLEAGIFPLFDPSKFKAKSEDNRNKAVFVKGKLYTITYKSRLTQKKLHKKTDAIFSIYG